MANYIDIQINTRYKRIDAWKASLSASQKYLFCLKTMAALTTAISEEWIRERVGLNHENLGQIDEVACSQHGLWFLIHL